MTEQEIEFLQQSNIIEGEYSLDALEDAKLAWNHILSMTKMTELAICRGHYLLMWSRTTIANEDKGVYTRYQTRVGKRLNPDPILIPALMADFIERINANIQHYGDNHGQQFREADTKAFHVRFERIHPFLDGNGRIGRMIYNWHRLRLGLPIHVILESERSAYYEWFIT